MPEIVFSASEFVIPTPNKCTKLGMALLFDGTCTQRIPIFFLASPEQ